MDGRVTKDESSSIFTHQGAAQAAWTANEKEKHSKGPNLFEQAGAFAEALRKQHTYLLNLRKLLVLSIHAG